MKKYTCVHCGTENGWKRSSFNKFCNNRCQNDFKWVNETLGRVERGEVVNHTTLKKYLVEKHGDQCAECGQIGVWNNKPLTLQLDHIDGNSDNNLPSNLRLLCPNCHTQTDTFGSKGKGNRYTKSTKRNVYLREYKKGS